jgi:uncharacterized protein YgbK (DUF1537 family)
MKTEIRSGAEPAIRDRLRPRGARLGCIADDYTGGTDVASGLRRVGLRTVLLFGDRRPDWSLPDCDAVVVALKSRNLPADEAVARSLAVQRWLGEQGVSQIYFKYCSTFDSTDDGNIGVVADALLDAANSSVTVVCPTSPEHHRTVYQGHLFVGDQLLSESSMRHHPLNPMTDSNLVRVLGRQTSHRVALIPHEVVRDGSAAVSAELERFVADDVRFAVVDAVSDADLRVIAAATSTLPVLTGAAGLARTFGDVAISSPDAGAEDEGVEVPAGPALILAGSCSAMTLRQVEHARAHFPSLRFDPRADGMEADALEWLEAHLPHAPLLVYSSAPPDERSGAAAPGEALVVERGMGALARHAVDHGVRRLLVAGGETSGAVVDALGIESVIVAGEEDPGVPWTVTETDPPLGLLLKSGNFGRRDLFTRALKVVTA